MKKSDRLIIMEKTEELVNSIELLSNCLPATDFHDIKFNLLSYLSMTPQKIEQGLKPSKKIEKVRNLIKATVALSEIKNYLNLAEELNYCKTREIINEVDSISRLLTSDYPAISLG